MVGFLKEKNNVEITLTNEMANMVKVNSGPNENKALKMAARTMALTDKSFGTAIKTAAEISKNAHKSPER